MLTRGEASTKSRELAAVAGIASSVIVDQSAAHAPIIVTCDGPRTRIYCVHDDDSLDESAANESTLGFDPLEGGWKVSLPCATEDLIWVQRALKQHSQRVTARDMAEGTSLSESGAASSNVTALHVDLQELFK